MMVYFLVFASQFFFNIFKTLEIKYTYEHKVGALLRNSVYINLVLLASTYFSLERLLAGEWIILIFYVSGSIVGKWVAMTKISVFKRKVQKLYIKLKK